MTRLTRKQVVATRHCPSCGAIPGDNCKAKSGAQRASVHLYRYPKPKREQHAQAAVAQKTRRDRILSAPHPARDQVRDATDCPRCTAKKGDYCHDRTGKLRVELHAPRWRIFHALPPPKPLDGTPPNS